LLFRARDQDTRTLNHHEIEHAHPAGIAIPGDQLDATVKACPFASAMPLQSRSHWSAEECHTQYLSWPPELPAEGMTYSIRHSSQRDIGGLGSLGFDSGNIGA
jgi:hypothetical protein